jgi:hypothetical protein
MSDPNPSPVHENRAGLKDPIEATPESLARILNERPVLWVGAGASVAAGYPGTNRLIEVMLKASDDAINPNLPFFRIADSLIHSAGVGTLPDLLQREIGPPRDPVILHHALARLAKGRRFSAILTTNYDSLIERALDEAHVPYAQQALDRNELVQVDGHIPLLKLHGSRDDWLNVILSGRSYEQFSKRYPFLNAQLDVLLRRHPVLFVGCSLQDPRILDWLADLPEDVASRLKRWRALMTAPEWAAALEAIWDRGHASGALSRGNIRPLILRDHDHLGELLAEVSRTLGPAEEVQSSGRDSKSQLRSQYSRTLPTVDIAVTNAQSRRKSPSGGPYWLVFCLILLVCGSISMFFWEKFYVSPHDSRSVESLASRPPLVVPPTPAANKVIRRHEFADPTYNSFDLISDRKVVDFRLWKRLTDQEMAQKCSPVTWTRVVSAIKRSAANEIRFQFSTSGLGIDFRCRERKCLIEERAPEPTANMQGIQKTYHVVVDVSDIAIGKEFSVVIESTYWNAFQREQTSNVTMRAHGPIKSMSMALILPLEDGKPPFYSHILEVKAPGEAARHRWDKRGGVHLVDSTKSWIYWEVKNPTVGEFYILGWQWGV